MSQVKNLRAMFENKGDDSSPPDRGRSPGPSGSTTPGASFTGSPRPLSRIRSSFVAIEKDGRMGLQRTNSDESSIARRRMSGDTDAESVSAMSDNKSVTTPGEEPTKTARRMFINDPIPESPRLPKDLEGSSHDIGAVTDEPSVNPDKQTDEEQPSENMLPADPTTAEVNKDSSKSVAGTAVANGKPKADSAKSTGAAAVKKTTARPSAISTKPAAKTAPPTKASATVKTPTSASSTGTAKPAVKATARPAAKTTAASTRPTASTVTKPTASSATKKPATLKPSTSGTGFVKPKVKSPTKPVNLPPSLMAQTAASGAKGSSARQSLTAQSGNTLARSSSRASTTTGGSKYPKAPVSKNPRPSIGPPPKKTEPQRPATRDSNVDEGFLARMMRPTASSAQKTADKTTLTPPKRTASRPSTTTSRRESSVRSLSRTKTPSVHASEPADDAKDKTASINEEEPNETAAGAGSGLDADLAHSAEEAQSLVVEEGATEVADEAAVEPEAAPAAEPLVETKANIEAVDDVVLETAVVETAEEAKEVAEEVDEVLSPAKTDEPVQASVNAEAAEVEDAAIEAANLETAEEAAAVADEAGLVQTPVEPEIDQQELSKEDELAVDAANVETAEDAAAIAAEADLVQTPVEPADHTDETESKEAAQSSEAPEATTDKGADLVTDEPKQFSPVSPAESDIDLLTEKLAETRIEAGDEKPVDEEAKQTR